MNKKNRWSARNSAVWIWTVVVALLLSASPANAHILSGEPISFQSGFMHPLSGWDHIIAMVAVGIWGAQLGKPAIWVLPVTFPMIMSFGGVLGINQVPLPGGEKFVEYGIALSGVILGAMVLREAKPKVWIAAATVGLFGLCHGYAHGYELPDKASGLYYSIGFVIATGTLHLCGITIGLIHRWPQGRIALRVCGAAILMGGLYFLYQAFQPESPETTTPGGNAAKAAALPHSTAPANVIIS